MESCDSMGSHRTQTGDNCQVMTYVPDRILAEVSELRRKVMIKDDSIRSFNFALTRLWEAVRIQTDQGVDDSELELSAYIDELDFQTGRAKASYDEVTDAFNNFKAKAQGEYHDLLLCPMLWAKKNNFNYCSSPLSFDDVKIKLSGGANPVAFEEGSKWYLAKYFPEDTTYRVPIGKKKKENQGSMKSDKRQLCHIPDDKLSEDKTKFAAILSNRKGRRANQRVAACLEKWGLQNNKTMMILTDLKMPDKNMNCPKDIVSNNSDFDVLVLCKEFVFLCQVKGVDVASTDGTKKKKLRESWEQTIKDIQQFGEITRDIPFVSKVPIYTAIAVPNLSSFSLDKLGVCYYHRQFTLTETEIGSFSRFETWMSKILGPPHSNCDAVASYTREEYDLLRARFVGIMCKLPINSEQAIVCDTDQLINPVKYTRPQKLHLILTPEQQAIVEDEGKLKIIQGNFGTGKSLVLIAKTQKLKNSGKPCCPLLISCADIGSDGSCYHRTKFQSTKHLKHLTDLSDDKSSTNICSITDLIRNYLAGQANNDNLELGIRTEVTSDFFLKVIKWREENTPSTVHFFLDEIPAYFFEKCENALRDFSREFPDSYLWIVVAVHSSKPTQKIHASYASAIDNLCQGSGFTKVELERNMRLPENVFNLVKFIQHYEYDNIVENVPSFESGHDILGPKPLFFEVPLCFCGCSKTQPDTPLTCACSERRLTCTLEQVMKKCHFKDETTRLEQSRFKILIGLLLGSGLTKTLCALLKRACATLGIKLNFNLVVTLDENTDELSDNTNNLSKIEIDVLDQYTYVGCEDAVIIGLDPYALLQCGNGNHWTHSLTPFTRTTALYIHVLWSTGEAKLMWHGDLDSHDNLTRERMNRGHLTEELQTARFSFTGQGRKSTGQLLEKLFKTQCVIKIPVEMKELKLN